MKRTLMLSVLALLLALSGCAAAPGQEEGPVLWFTGDLSDWENSSYSAMDTCPTEAICRWRP